MTVKLLTEHHLEFLSLKSGCTGSSESKLVKMPHCWKSHVNAHLLIPFFFRMVGGQFMSQPEFSLGTLSAGHRNAILIWRFAGGPVVAHFHVLTGVLTSE